MTMGADDFAFFQRFLSEKAGLHLWPEKGYLLEARLARILRQRGLDSLAALAGRMRAASDIALERDVVEAMMTHETLFFRDLKSFDSLRDVVLPQLMTARASERRLSIWCAACSTGQEPYSIAMMLSEMGSQLAGWSVQILATDLSTAVIERAKAGIYTQFEVQRGLPIRMLLNYFHQQADGWTLDKKIRDMVEFRPFNLLRDPTPFGRFDLILCRNVMIYFDGAQRARLFSRLKSRIAPDGALMLGGAETVLGVTTEFASLKEAPNFYRPVPADRQPVQPPASIGAPRALNLAG